MTKRTVDLLITVLFTAGLVILFGALTLEVISEPPAPIYVILGSFAAGLTITATFIATLRQ